MEQKEFRQIRPVAWYDGMTDSIRWQIYAEDNDRKLYAATIQWFERCEYQEVEPMITFPKGATPSDCFGNHPLRTFVNQLWEAGIKPTPDTDDRDKRIKLLEETNAMLLDQLRVVNEMLAKQLGQPVHVMVYNPGKEAPDLKDAIKSKPGEIGKEVKAI